MRASDFLLFLFLAAQICIMSCSLMGCKGSNPLKEAYHPYAHSWNPGFPGVPDIKTTDFVFSISKWQKWITHKTKTTENFGIFENFWFLTKKFRFVKRKTIILDCIFGLRHESLWYHSRIVQIQWIFRNFPKFWWLHQALTLQLFGVGSQPMYLRSSTPRAWSIARVKSRVARFYARFCVCWSESFFRKS